MDAEHTIGKNDVMLVINDGVVNIDDIWILVMKMERNKNLICMVMERVIRNEM